MESIVTTMEWLPFGRTFVQFPLREGRSSNVQLHYRKARNTTTTTTTNTTTNQPTHKVEVLQKRDREMSEFIEKFDQTKQEALDDQRSARSTIVGLLEHISTGLESQHHIPDKGGMRVSEPRTAYSRCPTIGGQASHACCLHILDRSLLSALQHPYRSN